jgi:Animal haem peroxidase
VTRPSWLSKRVDNLVHRLDRRYGWDAFPRPVGLLLLAVMRTRLRRENLYDTRSNGAEGSAVPTMDPRYEHARSVDGTWNDLGDPRMGSAGCRFGRNIPLRHTYPEPEPRILTPNPRLVSRELLTREQFRPATTLNLLAASWLQFEVHDWFSHGKGDWEMAWQLELEDADAWPERPMRIPRARRDPTSTDDGAPPTWITNDSHWWDGSQIYGSNERFAHALRANEGGKLQLEADGFPPHELEKSLDLSDVAGNFWVGLALLHVLFMLEHNAICDRLRAEHPTWSDDQLYDRARLVNSALMAKIHTVEWTPAIIAHPTTRLAMRANWWGIAGEGIKRRFGRISGNEVISGIPGSPTNHHGVPYSLTEEFTAVYRMHPLIPDVYAFRSLRDDSLLKEHTFPELNVLHARSVLGEVTMANVLYSFGIAHPGAIELHNYPRFLQNLERPDGTILDLAATDILRIRERGVPRYNEFRRLFHLEPRTGFEDLTPNPVWQEELRRLYDGDVENVDLMIGLYAEQPPKGFGFSDTAFRVFILMASRRLKSDRFLSADYRPGVYTRTGLEWVEENTLITVLLRHFPELAPALEGVENGFAPWRRVAV